MTACTVIHFYGVTIVLIIYTSWKNSDTGHIIVKVEAHFTTYTMGSILYYAIKCHKIRSEERRK